jgi:cytochrome c biogenesis protein CcmG/thiol:disulfide interchange protein DsbE
MNTSFINRYGLLPLAMGALLLNATASQAGSALKVGDSFPDMTSFKFEGKLPESLKGKVVLVDFWASWCGPCKGSFPVLEQLHKDYAAKGVVVLGINLDETKPAMDEFLAKHPITFPVVRDQKQEVAKVVKISTMPSSFILDGEGKVRFVHSGFHGADTQKQYVKEIEELLKGTTK